MKKPLNRRDLLKTALGGAAGSALWPVGSRLVLAATGEPAAVRLTGDLVQITGLGGNVVARTGANGLVLVDSGAPEHTEALVRFVADELGGGPVTALLNTHWHLPHTGANEHFGRAGARILAHENTRRWMSTEYYVEWEDVTYGPRPQAALPTDTFYSSDPQPLYLEHDGQRIEYAHLPEAHTDGDIYVRFPDDNVIVAGGVVGVGAYPVPDHTTGGWIGGLMDATRALIEMCDAGTRIVPGTGPAQTRADLEAQLEMLTAVHERISALMLEGKGTDEILAEHITEEFDAVWGEPTQFVSNIYDGLWWGGRLRGAY